MPGLTHWNHPRFFAYFANTGSEPGILAELLIAALNVEPDGVGHLAGGTELEQVVARLARASCSACPPGCTGTSRTRRRPRRWRRSRRRARGAPRRGRYRLRAGALLVEKAARILEPRVPDSPGRRRVPDARPTSRSTTRPRSSRRSGTTSIDVGRPGGRDRRAAASEAGVWLHVDAAYAGSAAVCPELRWCMDGRRPRRLDRRQPAQVAVHAGRLLDALDAPARGVPQGVRRAGDVHRGVPRARSTFATTARRSAGASAR